MSHVRALRSCVLVVALGLMLSPPAPGQAAKPEAPAPPAPLDWSVGVATVKITPAKPVVLAGYAARTKPHESVLQDIHAKALALRDAAGHRAVLLTVDLCIIPRDVVEGVRARVLEKHKLDRADFVLSLSHTHSGPAVSLKVQPATESGAVNRGSSETAEYTRWLQDRMVEATEMALAEMKPARLSLGTGIVNFPMNRRQFTDRGVILGVNPRGLVDRSVPVLRIDGSDGKPFAVLFATACHNTTEPSNNLGISGDYAGYAKAYVEKALPGVQALFMMGCGGDANPYPRQQPGHAAQHGEELGKEVCRVLETKLAPVHGPLTCAMETAELPLQELPRGELLKLAEKSSAQKGAAKEMLAALDKGEKLPASHRVPVSAWQFGADLTMIGLPNEVVVDYVQKLEDAVGPMRLWVAGYCHEVEGYVPSCRVLREGGYETRGLYLGAGFFAPATEAALVESAKRAAIKAGRKVEGR